MSKKRLRCAGRVLVACVLFSLQVVVLAADENRQYNVRAFSKVESCYALNRAVNSAKEEDDWSALYGFSLYTMGYLTAINRLAHDTYDIGGRKNTKTLMVWLEQYCAENPDDSYDRALHHLIAEIYPHRTAVAPQ